MFNLRLDATHIIHNNVRSGSARCIEQDQPWQQRKATAGLQRQGCCIAAFPGEKSKTDFYEVRFGRETGEPASPASAQGSSSSLCRTLCQSRCLSVAASYSCLDYAVTSGLSRTLFVVHALKSRMLCPCRVCVDATNACYSTTARGQPLNHLCLRLQRHNTWGPPARRIECDISTM